MVHFDRDYDFNRGAQRRHFAEDPEERGYWGDYGEYEWLQTPGATTRPFSGAPPYGGAQRGHWHGRTPAPAYRRSDERIREDVFERLIDHPFIDSSNINVEVEDGEVTLSGTVDDRREKRLAEDAAEAVPGVRDVHNRLRVVQAVQGLPAGARSLVREGMPVDGLRGGPVGTVRQTLEHEFLVGRDGAPDLYVPYEAVQDVEEQRVVLACPASEVEYQGWSRPLMAGLRRG